jgi:hypothetical protein
VKATAIDNRTPPPVAEPKDKKPSGFKAVIGKIKVAKRPADDAAPDAIPDQQRRPPEAPAIQLFPAISRTTSQIGGLVAAAVGKAIAALGQIATEVAAAEKPQAATVPEVTPQIPFTPLEQAVHDLISQLQTEDRPAQKPVAIPTHTPESAAAPARLDRDRPEPIAPIKELQPPSELPQVTSHVHLVLDDGPERVVMTVAVRGSEVNVALRGNHEATAAALARNAASLDHALRARGLDLTDFSAERDPDARRAPQQEQREREQPSEAFDLEEHA